MTAPRTAPATGTRTTWRARASTRWSPSSTPPPTPPSCTPPTACWPAWRPTPATYSSRSSPRTPPLHSRPPGALRAARAPPRPRLLQLRARGRRLAAPGPLGHPAGGAHRGARGGDPERRRALRGVAARGVPAERRVPGPVHRSPGRLGRAYRPCGGHRHRDGPRRTWPAPGPRLTRPRRYAGGRADAPLGPPPARPGPAALRDLHRPGPGHRRHRAALARRPPRPGRRGVRRRLDGEGRDHPRTGGGDQRVRGDERDLRLRPGDRGARGPGRLRPYVRHPRGLPDPLGLPQLHGLRPYFPYGAPRRPGRAGRLPRREVLPGAGGVRRLGRLPGGGGRALRRGGGRGGRGHQGAAGRRPGADLGGLGGRRADQRGVRRPRRQPGQAGRGRDHPGPAAPGPLEDPGQARGGRGPPAHPAAGRTARRPGRGGRRPPVQLCRSDPPRYTRGATGADGKAVQGA